MSSEAGYKSDEDEIVLASTSPRRRDLLSRLSIRFRVVPPSVSEDVRDRESPREMVERLALSKARNVGRSLRRGLVVGADSVVVIDGRVLGKPTDDAEAREMLKSLRGREHQVVTGVTVVDALNQQVWTANQVSTITMREYSDQEIEAYVTSGEPMDKAGAYAVQDRDFRPATLVEGCYANVVGLPLCLLVDMLKDAGYKFGPQPRFQVPEGCSSCPLEGGRPESTIGRRLP